MLNYQIFWSILLSIYIYINPITKDCNYPQDSVSNSKTINKSHIV